MIDHSAGYIKGKQIYRLQDVKPGAKYIIESLQFGEGVRVVGFCSRLQADPGKTGKPFYGAYFDITRTKETRFSDYNWYLWDFYIKPNARIGDVLAYNIWEAVEPAFTCKECGSHKIGMPVSAVSIINGQRIGRTCNYYRCPDCNTLNRHVWITGYPTK